MSNSNLGASISMYLLGPGVGESIVLRMPDDRIVVVDSCVRAGVNLPVQLLTELGIGRIDLLVVTHPDLDHVKGLPELIDQFRPSRIWRYPFGLLREMLAQVTAAANAGPQRHVEAFRALIALDEHLAEIGTVEQITYGRTWSPPSGGYAVHALAPTHYDIKRAVDRCSTLVERRRGQWVLSSQGKDWLGGARGLGDLPNMVSLGLAVEWGTRRVVLAGDIENGDGTSFSGWRGVLDHLDRVDDQRGHLVSNVDIIKIAHHGSKGAFEGLAWDRHAQARKTVGLVTTYSPSRLPDDATLAMLRARCQRLGITCNAGDAFDRAMNAGWGMAAPRVQHTTLLPCLQITLFADGSMQYQRGSPAEWFA